MAFSYWAAQSRLLAAEKLIGLTLAVMPKGHPDTARLARALLEYVRTKPTA
jgi:hypothetical protein